MKFVLGDGEAVKDLPFFEIVSRLKDVADRGERPMFIMRDRKSRLWASPQVFDSVDAAIRNLKYMAKYGKDVNTGALPLFVEYPNDFQLVFVGVFNSLDGTIVPLVSSDFVSLEVVDILKGE